MTVSQQERDAMAKLLSIMNGEKPISESKTTVAHEHYDNGSILSGPGVTSTDITAMKNILSKLHNLPTSIRPVVINEAVDPELEEAIQTDRTANSVNVGRYQIMIKENPKRLAGKQYYSIYHSVTNDVIADDLSLYETALAAVRLLNNGKFANCKEIRKLFEQDDIYTSHRVDALMYKRKLNKNTDPFKQDIYESRYQASIDKAMIAKKQIKVLANDR
jgi:hypothetical protein